MKKIKQQTRAYQEKEHTTPLYTFLLIPQEHLQHAFLAVRAYHGCEQHHCYGNEKGLLQQ